MIGALSGQIKLMTPPFVILDVGGIGYEIEAPLSTYCLLKLDMNVTLWVHHVVREDAHLLFGFLTTEEKSLFRLLIRANGVGPKLACSILSAMTTPQLIDAIDRQDIIALVQIPGVGKKTAERLVIELRDRIAAAGASVGDTPLSLRPASASAEAEAALISLGYKSSEAQKAIALAAREHSQVTDLIRAALKSMVKN